MMNKLNLMCSLENKVLESNLIKSIRVINSNILYDNSMNLTIVYRAL